MLERDPLTGRYPQRRESQASWSLPLAEYVRMTIIGAAQERGLKVVTTNSATVHRNEGPCCFRGLGQVLPSG